MGAPSDSTNRATQQPNTRWSEAKERLKEMLEVLAYVPFNQIGIEFLNRKDRINLTRQGRDPKTFLADAFQQVESVFAHKPSGTTPAFERLSASFNRAKNENIARYFFGDGVPNVSFWKYPILCACVAGAHSNSVLSFTGWREGTKGNYRVAEEPTEPFRQPGHISQLYQCRQRR